MARRKKSGLAALVGDLSLSHLAFHPATLFVAFHIGLAATAMYCWERYQSRIIDPSDSLLSAANLKINPPPDWAKTDIHEAIANSSAEPHSLFDHGLIPDIVNTCQTIGWIEQVRKVRKTRDGVEVDLAYREPVATVELRTETVPHWNQPSKLIPVDRTGVIMPESLANMVVRQPKIFVFHSDGKTSGEPRHLQYIYDWTEWPDVRVRDAAAISQLVATHWEFYGLSRIISWRTIAEANEGSIPFEFWTDRGDKAAIIVWGNPPGSEIGNEAPAMQKLAALHAYVEKNGSLEKLPKRIVDVRSGQAIEVGPAVELGYRRNFSIR